MYPFRNDKIKYDNIFLNARLLKQMSAINSLSPKKFIMCNVPFKHVKMMKNTYFHCKAA